MKTTFILIASFLTPLFTISAIHNVRDFQNQQQIQYIKSIPTSIAIDTEGVEVAFVPDATVTIADSEVEIDFVADERDVVCGEYTCTFTPLDVIALRAER